ncbi:hypothetical protein Tco_1492304 [Tanacetum coccineum]
MSAITDVKCVLTQKALDAFCNKFYILEEVHLAFPNQNDTMHERPARKIGLYTRFFDFANFRFPLSTFLVDVLRHFRINISQLSVIGAAKVSYFEIVCRVYGIIPTVGLYLCFYVNSKKSGWMSFSKRSDNASVCYTKPLDSLKIRTNTFSGWMTLLAPASFPWHIAKYVTRDPAPVAVKFNAQDYATLVAHPSLFWKFPEACLCLVGLSRHYTLDEETYPQFLHKNREGGCLLVRHSCWILPLVALFRCFQFPLIVLKASVEKLFDEGGSGNQTEQGDSVGDGQDANIQLVVKAADTDVEDVAPVQPRRQGKRKSVTVDAGGVSHPPKKLREDHGTPSGTSIGGKSRFAIKSLLVGAVLNAKVGVAAIPTLPFVTASVSTTLKREGRDHTDSVAELNLRTIEAPSFVPIMTTVATITSTVDPTSVAKEKLVEPSPFCAGSSSAGGNDPTMGVFSDLTGSDFLVGAIRTVINPDTDLQKIYVPQWSMTNGFRLYNGRICREMVDEFAPPKFFTSVHGMEHDQLFTEFNVRSARQMSLSVKVREEEIENLKAQLLLREAKAAEAIRLRVEAFNFEVVERSLWDEMNAFKERNVILEKEQNALDVKVIEFEASAASKEHELTDLNALVNSVKSQHDNLMNQAHELEISSFRLLDKVTVYENCMDQLKKFQDDRMKVVNDKFDKLYTDFMEMNLHLEEKFYPHLLTTIFRRRWLLTHGMELAIVNCLNSPEYLSALGAAIGKAIEKGMKDGLSARITHGKEGRVLKDVAAYNLSEEVDYISALQQLQNVNFSLLAELKSNKLMVLIHRSPDQVVVGATALSLTLDVSSVRVRKIRENIATQRSALRNVFVPLAEPFFVAVLTGTKGTSDIAAATTNTNMTLSTTFASARSIALISVDDYEVVGVDDQAVADENVASFPNVNDAELNSPQ